MSSLEKTASSLRKRLARVGEDLVCIADQGKKALTDAKNVASFKVMFEDLNRYFLKFESLWDDLIDISEDESVVNKFPGEEDQKLKASVKNRYVEAKCTFAKLNPPDSSTRTIDPSMMNFSVTQSELLNSSFHLPPLSLPTFDGRMVNWPKFRDAFKSIVHEDNSISSLRKLHYLVGACSGSAATIVNKLPLLADNYDVIWLSLSAAYDQKRLLACSYLNEVQNFKPLSKPSIDSYQLFLSKVCDNINAFKSLNIPKGTISEFLLFYLASRCLDQQTRESFEDRHRNVDYPTFDQLADFVRTRCLSLQLAKPAEFHHDNETKNNQNKPGSSKGKIDNSPRSRSSTSTLLTNKLQESDNTAIIKTKLAPSEDLCVACKLVAHKLLDCEVFAQASIKQRLHFLRSWKGCGNCLSGDHEISQCPSKWTCKFCRGKHHHLLHSSPQHSPNNSTGTNRNKTPNKPAPQVEVVKEESSELTLTTTSPESTKVLLGTIVVEVQDGLGIFRSVRAVIDSGSQNSFMTQKCWTKLGLPSTKCLRRVSCLGGALSDKISREVSCRIRPRNRASPNLTITAQIVRKITNDLPNFSFPQSSWHPYTSYQLADPHFFKSQPIEMLLGCDIVARIMEGQVIDLNNEGPKLFASSFGYVVMGQINVPSYDNESTSLFTSSVDVDLDKTLRKFWELEEVSSISSPCQSEEDKKCEEFFVNTHSRDKTGRYIVRLPFTEPSPHFEPSLPLCMRSLLNLENKLRRNETLRQQYHDFINEYIDLGHMTLAQEDPEVVIPHHAVLKEDRAQIKLRVVFNASAKMGSTSLNDKLMVGPKLQTNFRDILLRFRIYLVVLIGDIVKMYRQILIDPRDRRFLHVLWRSHPSEAIKIYILLTVLYGLCCAPYLALRVLRQLAKDEGHQFSKAATILLRDTYIDDVVSGADTIEEAIELRDELIGLLRKGGFELSKWASNRPEVLEAVSKSPDESYPIAAEEDYCVKILGLQWNSRIDKLFYKIDPPEEKLYTKRQLSSAIAKIFDPLGYLAPIILLAKSFLQDTWKANIGWDELIPDTLQKDWQRFIRELPSLGDIKIPRCLFSPGSKQFQIVGFSDASNKGLGATFYIRTIINGEGHSSLLLARTKLAPVKTVSIPRLELCAALLLAQTYSSLFPFLDSLPQPAKLPCFFTDSTIVLAWLKMSPHKLNTFVANRITQILEITPMDQWHHVSSQDNASDASSRGLMPSEIVGLNIWWHGPKWLTLASNEWPNFEISVSPEDLPELKNPSYNQVLVAATNIHPLEWMSRFSSFIRLIQFVGILRRAINNFRNKSSRVLGPLTLKEFKSATESCIKIIQLHLLFEGDQRQNMTAVIHRFRKLNPFLDESGVFRVGGRLQKSSVSYSTKHPILLPRCHFVTIMVDYYHKIFLHPGPSLLQALIQLKFWIPGLRTLVRQRTFLCMRCYKFTKGAQSAEKSAPLMGNLPEYRVNPGRAFQHVGLDFSGPLQMRDSLRRKAAVSKVYICLFVCMQTKALHLEAVTSLSTESFLASFTRFVSRRGLVQALYSDCGSNFIGASRQLQELQKWFIDQRTQDSILAMCNYRGVEWHFNPASSPHMGGLWEAGVKSVKRHILAVAGDTALTYEELATLLTKIEAILNSRPLCPLSTSPEETEYLSPGHFLIGGNLMDNPEPSLLDIADSRLNRWQLVKKMYENLWRRWHLEYLSTLQARAKWTKSSINIQVGDLVLMRDQRMPILQWPLAKVINTHPGTDGVVRAVTVATPSSSFKRPVVKLVKLLPLDVPAFPDKF